MKKLSIGFLLVSCFIHILPLYANENSFSFGLENLFGYRSAESLYIEYKDVDYSQKSDYSETNTIIAPGFNVFGRFLGGRGFGGFFRVNALFPVFVDYTKKSSVPLVGGLISSSSGTWKPFDYNMVMTNIGGGVSWAIPLSETFNLIFDTGLALQADAFMSDDTNGTVILGLGIIGDVAFQYNISRLLRLEAGINLDLARGLGVYRFANKDLSMLTRDVIVSASPYIALGMKWGSGINRRKKANDREKVEEKNETDRQSYEVESSD